MSSPATPQTASLHTLGCKLNYAETSTLSEGLSARGYDIVPFGQKSDVVILNTCTVTSNAERDCRQLIRRIHRKSPATKIVVTGCYAQLRPEEIASIEGVSLVLGAKEKFELPDHLSEESSFPRIAVSDIADSTDFQSASSLEERTRAFLKVQDGCDYSCSFCTIPKARGASRSGKISEIVARAIQLSHDGFHEIILSGVNVGDFGKKSGASFLELIQALDSTDEVTARIRISSIEPNLLTDEIIEFVASSPKFCPHFHIPLQSGSASVLRRMQRRYLPDLYRSRIETIKRVMPNAGIGADVIVGFPGETEDEFLETVQFIESLKISYLHVFTYSERPGTKSAEIPNQIAMDVRRDRNRTLRLLSEKKKRAFYRSHIGSESTAVLEPNGEGYTENYIRVIVPDKPQGAEVVRMKLTECRGDYVTGDILTVLAERRQEMLLPILCN